MQALPTYFETLVERRPSLTFGVVVFLAFLAFCSLTKKHLVPESLPWVGRPTTGPFIYTRASLSSFSNVRIWLKEGYAKVGGVLRG